MARFSFDDLIARNIPETPPTGAPNRAKYDFAVAYPDPESLPLDDLAESLKTALQEEGEGLAVYPHPQGYPPLREFVAGKLADTRDMAVSPDDVVLADGSSQPLHMLTEALVNPGDVVITDDFVYSGTLGIFRRFKADIRGVETDGEGMRPDVLESTVETAISEGKRPKLIYAIPTFQNPQGWTMPVERRQAVLEISRRHGVPILEDDCYVDLRFEGESVPAIHSLDDDGLVMYVGSFSKIIAPGMRLGYVTAPSELLDRARAVKSGGGVNQFAALAVHRYATTGLYDHVDDVNRILRRKRDAMLAALGENLGSAGQWSHPNGALYIWLQMPETVDLVDLQQTAFDAEVGYQPGPAFAPDGVSGRNYARLCFGYNTPDEIGEGIARLANVLDKAGHLG